MEEVGKEGQSKGGREGGREGVGEGAREPVSPLHIVVLARSGHLAS